MKYSARSARLVAVAVLTASIAAEIRRATVCAGFVHTWSMPELVKLSDVLAVGEVLKVAETGKIPRDIAPLVRRNVRVRILRSFTGPGSPDAVSPAPGSVVSVVCIDYDWALWGVVANPTSYPRPAPGEVYVFPLRRTTLAARYGARPEKALEERLDLMERYLEPRHRYVPLENLGRTREGHREWALAGEEGNNLLLPCAAEPPPGEKPKTPLEFLQRELAGAFADGRYADVVRAAHYFAGLRRHHREAAWVGDLYRRINSAIGDDEALWFRTSSACINSANIVPFPGVRDLLSPQTKGWLYVRLASMALRRVRREGLEERLIASAFENMNHHLPETARALARDFRDHPLTARLLREQLRATPREAVHIAVAVVGSAEHPLAGEALRAARQVLSAREFPGYFHLQPAMILIHRIGTEQDLGFLQTEFRKALAQDRERVSKLWTAFPKFRGKGLRRTVSVIRILIEGDWSPGPEYSGHDPILALQNLTGEDFGLKYKHTDEERKLARVKALSWLRQRRK